MFTAHDLLVKQFNDRTARITWLFLSRLCPLIVVLFLSYASAFGDTPSVPKDLQSSLLVDEYSIDNSSSDVGFARWLFREGDYYRALSEFDRLLAFNPKNSDLSVMAAGAAYLTNNPNYLEGLSRAKNISSSTKTVVNKLISVHYLKVGGFDLAKKHWVLTGEQQESFFAPAPPIYDPDSAAWRSTVIPGWGLFHTGEYAKGVGSFLLNAIFIGLTIDSYQRDNHGASLLFAFFEWQWYKGGISAARESAEKANRTSLNNQQKDWIRTIEGQIFSF